MNDTDLAVLVRDAITASGESWRSQPSVLRRRLELALGSDLPASRSKVHLLVAAAEERVPSQLSRVGAAEPQVRDVAAELAATRGWTPDAATWAVSFWVTVLGLDSARATILPPLPFDDSQEPSTPPAPVPAPPPAVEGSTILPSPPLVAARLPSPPLAAPLPPPPAAPLPPPPAAPLPPPPAAALPPPPAAALPPPPAARPAPHPAVVTSGPVPLRANPTSGTAKPKTVAKMAAYLGRPVDAGFVGYDGNPTAITAAIAVLVISGAVAILGIGIASVAIIWVGAVFMGISGIALPVARKQVPVRWVAVSGDQVAVISTVRDSSNTPVATGVVFDGPIDAVQPVEGSTNAVMVGSERVSFLRSRRQSMAALVGMPS